MNKITRMSLDTEDNRMALIFHEQSETKKNVNTLKQDYFVIPLQASEWGGS